MILLPAIGAFLIPYAETEQSPALTTCPSLRNHAISQDMLALPNTIQEQMKQLVPDMAPRDAKFQKGDVIVERGLPTRRFIGAVQNAYTWVVVYEHTQGSVYHIHAVTFGRAAAGDYTQVPYGALTGPLCPVVDAALSGARSTVHF